MQQCGRYSTGTSRQLSAVTANSPACVLAALWLGSNLTGLVRASRVVSAALAWAACYIGTGGVDAPSLHNTWTARQVPAATLGLSQLQTPDHA